MQLRIMGRECRELSPHYRVELIVLCILLFAMVICNFPMIFFSEFELFLAKKRDVFNLLI